MRLEQITRIVLMTLVVAAGVEGIRLSSADAAAQATQGR